MTNQFISVDLVVNVYNEAAHIAEFLDSLKVQTYSHFRIILVDDGSTDRTIEIAESYQNQLSLDIVRLSHVGLRGARAEGVKRVTGDIFIIFDADQVIAATTIEHMVTAFADPQVAAVTGHKLAKGNSWSARGNRIVSLAAYRTLKHKDSTAEHMTGGCFACRTEVIKALGGFVAQDEFAEDAEITWRLREQGWKVIARDDVIVYHNDPVGLWEIFKWGGRMGRLGAHTRLRYREKLLKWHLLIRFGPLGLVALLPFQPKLAGLGLAASFLLFILYVRNIPGSLLDKSFGWIVFLVKTLGWSVAFVANLGLYFRNQLKRTWPAL